MAPAEVLDTPRVLAIATEPVALVPGGEHTLRALLFEVSGELAWSFCAEAWAATDPPSCPSGEVTLGRGNPLVATLPEVESGWLLARGVDSPALPAVKRLERDAGGQNPIVRGLVTGDGTAPTSIAPGASVELVADLTDLSNADQLVVSWYVTAGRLEPARTLASEPASLEAPRDATALRLIAVVREKAGGTAWAEATLEVSSGASR